MKIRRQIAALLPNLSARYAAFRLRNKSTEAVFSEIFKRKGWGSDESASGTGSEIDQTKILIQKLPQFFRDIEIGSILDIPCGDFHWMSQVDLGTIQYIGADLLPQIIQENTNLHARENVTFRTLNLIRDPLPRADLVLCRDCLVHFSFKDAMSALKNICQSQSKYLLTTTFTTRVRNRDITTGQWYPIHLQIPPFDFPPPLAVINEGCTENGGIYSDKSLALWRISEITPVLP